MYNMKRRVKTIFSCATGDADTGIWAFLNNSSSIGACCDESDVVLEDYQRVTKDTGKEELKFRESQKPIWNWTVFFPCTFLPVYSFSSTLQKQKEKKKEVITLLS